MKKHFIFLLVVLLTFSSLVTVYADEDSCNHSNNIILRAPACSDCGIGVLLRTSRTLVGEESTSSSCYYTGCLIIKYYDIYQETYKCNYCGARETSEVSVYTGSEHTLSH